MDIPDKAQREWLAQRMEPILNRRSFPRTTRARSSSSSSPAEEFERFLHTRYIGQKRFSIEGGEALVPLLNTLIEDGAEFGVQEVVMGMAHRGRLTCSRTS
jgi:2-oxoglutarate dehydrogenase E1 component